MPSAIHVVATLNLTRAAGRLQHVTPVPDVPVGQRAARARSRASTAGSAATGNASLRLVGTGGRRLGEYPATIIPDACLDAGEDRTGMIDMFVPAATASRVELLLNGEVVDTFTPGGAARAAANIRAVKPVRRRGVRAADAAESQPVITWTEKGVRSRSRAAAADTGTRYNVQVSVDEGATWQTIGFGLREPKVTLDRAVLGDAETVKVRVTSTNGMRATSTESEMKVSDLA